MKKLAAISFLLLLLFNLFGYRFVFYYAQQQADVQLEASLDKEAYNEADLITIKVPLSLPYYSNSGFERVNGEINLHGNIYKYVKRKVTNGELVLLCLPDQGKMHLQSAKVDFFKVVNDVAQNCGAKKSEKSKAPSFKNEVSEYDAFRAENAMAVNKLTNKYPFPCNLFKVVSAPHISPEQPPEIV